ncbi:MAG TPA: hypothetical protein VFX70_11290 [Mycobacteriales bacterium]|nr:hypothetical protein [Mycobacteriales bacterium]
MLRASWHPSEGMVVLSLWEWDHCRATFRLAPTDVPDLIALLAGGLPDHAGPPRAAAGGEVGGPGGYPAGPPFPGPPQVGPPGQFAGQFADQPPGPFPEPYQNRPAERYPDQFPGQFPDQFPGQFADQFPGRPPEPVPTEAPFFTAGGFQTEQRPGYPPVPEYSDAVPPVPPAPMPPAGAAGAWPPPGPLPGGQFPAGRPDLPPGYQPPDFSPALGQSHGYPPPADFPPTPDVPAWEPAGRAFPPEAHGARVDREPAHPGDYLGPRTGYEFPAVGQLPDPVAEPVAERYDRWPPAPPDRPADPEYDRPESGQPGGFGPPGGGSWGGGSWGGQGAPQWDERPADAPGRDTDRGAELESTQFHPGPDYGSVPDYAPDPAPGYPPDYPPAEFTGDPRLQPAADYPPPFAPTERDRRPREDPFVLGENYPSRS